MRSTAMLVVMASAAVACGRPVPRPEGTTRAPQPLLDAVPARPQLMFISVATNDSHGRLAVASLAAPDRGRHVTPLSCDRVYFAAGRGICLASVAEGPSAAHVADVFDDRFETTHRIRLTGAPSRVRVSSDGRRAAATVFESGHSYAQGGFSTRTTVIDLESGAVVADLEQFEVRKDGARIQAKDFNFWGLTFARDGNSFYATLDTAGTSFLVKGDVDRRTVDVVRAGVECPSLSPDGSAIVFKKRLGSRSRGWWQLARLDLGTNTETVLASETRSVDDQVEWLDDKTVLYHLTGAGSAADLWALPIDGTSEPRLLVRDAYSPAVVR